jgi:hypothetical protein
MTVLTDIARKHVLTTCGNWLGLPAGDDPRVARFISAHDAALTRRILLARGIWVRVVDDKHLPILEGGGDIEPSRKRVSYQPSNRPDAPSPGE